jgi:hypothetical protein
LIGRSLLIDEKFVEISKDKRNMAHM